MVDDWLYAVDEDEDGSVSEAEAPALLDLLKQGSSAMGAENFGVDVLMRMADGDGDKVASRAELIDFLKRMKATRCSQVPPARSPSREQHTATPRRILTADTSRGSRPTSRRATRQRRPQARILATLQPSHERVPSLRVGPHLWRVARGADARQAKAKKGEQ